MQLLINLMQKVFLGVRKKEMSGYSADAQSEFFLQKLKVYVPTEKLMEWYLLLLSWVGSIVFTIIAMLQLSKLWTVSSGDAFDDTNGKAMKSFATFSSFALVCILLTQFLTLRVTLACDACA
jgi:hypothetical protein